MMEGLNKNIRSLSLFARFLLNGHSDVNLIKRTYSAECLKSTIPNVNIPNDNVVNYVMKDFDKWPNKIAVQCAVSEKKYTYDDLRIKSRNLGNSLRKVLGLKQRDVIALLLPNGPQFVVSAFGVLQSGFRLTTINPLYTAEEIQRQLLDANVNAIITLNDLLKNVQISIERGNLKIPIVVATNKQGESIPTGVISYEELTNLKSNISIAEQLNPDEALFLPYSSGTTGVPKGVMLTNTCLAANIAQYHAFGFIEEATGNFQDILPAILPMFHIYGFTMCTLGLLQKGSKLITLPKFSPDLFLRVLEDYHPTVLKVAPPTVIFLNTYPAVKATHLQNIRNLQCGAAPLGKLDEDKFREKVQKPVNVLQAYGLTEASPLVTNTFMDKQGMYPGTMGELVPNIQVKVVKLDDPEEKHVGPNEIGELLIKGPNIMKGYFQRPDESQKAFTSDGWLRTGDMVQYDKDGMFYIADRIKELIKVKGFQVAPAELEEIIRNYPGVADAAVIGIPHYRSGEVPRAYVTPKVGTKVDAKKIQEYVQEKVAPYKTLVGGVAIVDEIPKNASGKILRRQLKLMYENGT